MEIEKKRETIWKIKQRDHDSLVELISVEESGEVNIIKFMLKKSNDSICVEMNKSEFNNLLSVLSAFKDVVFGAEMEALQSSFKEVEEIQTQDFEETGSSSEEIYNSEVLTEKEDIVVENEVAEEEKYEQSEVIPENEDIAAENDIPEEEKFEEEEELYPEEELNPKEWDPW